MEKLNVAFIGSECYPFVKSGGLGDVMYALPRALVKEGCDVRVILPNYRCIPQKWKDQMTFVTSYGMDLPADGKVYHVGIFTMELDGVTYYFIDNEEFYSEGKPYTEITADIPKYCFFSKAALTVCDVMGFYPDIIHAHDWQAALVPLYLRTRFAGSKLDQTAKTVLTIHNLRFQGVSNINHLKYWSGLPESCFDPRVLGYGDDASNMMKGGIDYSDKVTTVSNTYALEIMTQEYGENLEGHLSYHANKVAGIVNGIDTDQWNPDTDPMVVHHYNRDNVLYEKNANKRALQEEVGLEVDENKFVIGLISRLTDQKGLDLVNAIMNDIVDDHTQVVILGTGDKVYENSFAYYQSVYPGKVSANIMYDETLSHHINAGCDALLVPSRFEPCGLTQMNAMRYGTVPIVRETGGLKDTVEQYNEYENTGNGFSFDRYDAGLLLGAVNYAKTTYFEHRDMWDQIVVRDMDKDVSWANSAKQYLDMYWDLVNR